MSVSTASGECSATDGERAARVGHDVDELDVLDLGQQRRHTLADQVVVVGEDDTQRHAPTVVVVLAVKGRACWPQQRCCLPHRAPLVVFVASRNPELPT